ncbi:MAG: hypothetical protein M3Y51_10825 [Actinomycetota bacterium]|nr:hypothetical protein [Actinomycetota bacterium]
MRLGADPEQLRELSAALRAAARSLDEIGPGTERRIRHAGWQGPDAIRFEGTWRQCRRDLTDAAGRCRDLSARIERQADEQIEASLGRVTDRSAAPLPAFAPSETRYVGGVDLRVGPVVATVAGDLSIADLDGDTTRVTLSETIAAGGVLSAGAGTSFSLADEVASPVAADSGSADARLRLGGVRRSTWEVPDDRVDDLLVDLAAIRVSDAAPWPIGALRDATGWFDAPEPTRSEALVEIDASAAGALAAGASGMLGVSGATSSTVRAGRAQIDAGDGPPRHSTVVEWTANSHATLTSSVLRRFGVNLPDPTRLGVSVRLELGESPDGSPQLDLRLSGITDDRIDDVAARIEPGDRIGTAATVAALDMVRHLERGDLTAAIDALGRMDVPIDGIDVVTARGSIDGTSARGSASAGAGPGVGLTVRGQRIQIDRSPTIGG